MAEKKQVERVELLSSEGEVIIVDKKVARRLVGESRLGNNNENLYFENVRSFILRKMILWSYYHKNNNQSEMTDNESKLWYKKFFDEDRETLSELVEAADLLDIKELASLTWALLLKDR